MSYHSLFLGAAVLVSACGVYASPCANDDLESRVSGVSQCLLMRRYGPLEPEAMLVWLHGDVSKGGPAAYHFAIAREAATQLAPLKVLSVALVRPGYPDGSGASSSVSLQSAGRWDHYTEDNMAEVGAAIERLRSHFMPKTLVLVGHSGGAATGAVLLGMRPGLIDAAVLVSCPCDLVAWRFGRREWGRSENPMKWAERVNSQTAVIALTGTRDDNTSPELARSYIDALRSRGVEAQLLTLPAEDHDSAFRSPEVINAVRNLLTRR